MTQPEELSVSPALALISSRGTAPHHGSKRYATAGFWSVAFTFAGIAGYLGLPAAAQAEALSKPAPLTVCHQLSVGRLIALAEVEGDFAAEGLEVTLLPFPSGRDALAAMLDGKCDLATTGEMPIVLTAFERNDFRILVTTGLTGDSDRIVAPKAAGIRTVGDLKGKRVGIITRTSSPYFLDRLLIASGILRRDVLAVPEASPVTAISALIRGEVDAISIWTPLNEDARRGLGGELVELVAPGVHFTSSNLVARVNVLNDRQGDIRALLRGLLKAESSAARNPAAAQELVSKKLNIDKAAVEALWATTGSLQMTLTQSLLLQLEDEARWASAEGLTGGGQRPNFLDFLAMDVLLSIAPDRVTIEP